MNNGSGLRVVLWLSGCDHKCKGCQNPQTWDANSGILFDAKAKEELFRELDKDYISGLTLTGGDPLHPSNLDGVLDIVTEFNKRYRITQDMVSNENDNHNMLNGNVNKIRLLCPNKTIWIYSGFTWEQIFSPEKCYKQIDELVLEDNNWATLKMRYDNSNFMKRAKIIGLSDIFVDGCYIDSQRNIQLRYRGSENQRVIDVQESLRQNKIVLYCD